MYCRNCGEKMLGEQPNIEDNEDNEDNEDLEEDWDEDLEEEFGEVSRDEGFCSAKCRQEYIVKVALIGAIS